MALYDSLHRLTWAHYQLGRPAFLDSAVLLRRRADMRNRCHGQRQRCQLEQQQHVVIGGCPVHPQPPAAGAAMDEHPSAIAADGHGYRLHATGALGLAIAGHVAVEVPRP
jgi:hypothetical protein